MPSPNTDPQGLGLKIWIRCVWGGVEGHIHSVPNTLPSLLPAWRHLQLWSLGTAQALGPQIPLPTDFLPSLWLQCLNTGPSCCLADTQKQWTDLLSPGSRSEESSHPWLLCLHKCVHWGDWLWWQNNVSPKTFTSWSLEFVIMLLDIAEETLLVWLN